MLVDTGFSFYILLDVFSEAFVSRCRPFAPGNPAVRTYQEV
jgi:hypothetical protein